MRRNLPAAALLAAALFFGCSKKADDSALVTNIKAQLFSDAQTKSASLNVTSNDGQVTLAGSVPNDAARYEAYKIATQTPGVTKVNDQMTVDTAQQPVAAEPTPAPAPAPPAATPPPPSRPSPRELRRARERQREEERREREQQNIESADNVQPPPPQQAPIEQTPAPVDQPPATPPPAPQPPPPPRLARS